MKTHLIVTLTLLVSSLLSFGENADQPAKAITLTAETDYALLSPSGEDTAILKVGLHADRLPSHYHRTPINLVIVLDRSGSMTGDKIEMARRATLQAFNELRPDDRISIVTYSDHATTVLPLTRAGSVENPSVIISQIRAGGSTALYAGVNQGAAELRRYRSNSEGPNRILLLSDGLANQGPSKPVDFQLLGRALSREDITVSTIGLGLDYNEDLMTTLAQSGQGNVYFAENARDLPRIFESELGDTASLVAQDAVIEVECLDGFRPLRVIGRDGKIEGQRVTLEISHLYAGREKYVLIEVANRGGRDGETCELARIDARTQSLMSGETIELHTNATAKFAADKGERLDSVNLAVQRRVVENKIAVAKEEAILLADTGDNKAASQVMADLNVWITANNAQWNDHEIAVQNAQLETQASDIEQNGVDKKTRKAMKASSYQSRSQQSYK